MFRDKHVSSYESPRENKIKFFAQWYYGMWQMVSKWYIRFKVWVLCLQNNGCKHWMDVVFDINIQTPYHSNATKYIIINKYIKGIVFILTLHAHCVCKHIQYQVGIVTTYIVCIGIWSISNGVIIKDLQKTRCNAQ